MTEPPIYPGHTPPAIRVACIVGWNGREFRAIRLVRPKPAAIQWATYKDGDVVWLPPRGQERRWGRQPDWWRPVVPESYPGALPVALSFLSRGADPACRPGISDGAAHGAGSRCSRTGARGQDTASGAHPNTDSEMDAHGPTVIASNGGVPPLEPSGQTAWWLDPDQVTYSPAGEITRREAEGRLMRAVSRAGVVVDLGSDVAGGSAFADLVEAAAQVLGETDPSALAAIVPRFEPTPADIADWLTAMGWFAALNPPELRHKRRRAWALNQRQRILVWRSGTRPYPWDVIADEISRSKTRAVQLYEDAIDKAWRAANGRQVFRHVSQRDPMDEVRAANRAHRMREGA